MKSRRMVGFVLLALLSLSLSLPCAHSHFHHSEKKVRQRPWPCCDSCGACTKSIPPQCQCRDLVRSCHPMCRNCVKSPLTVDPPLYQCMDLIPNYCKRSCASRLYQ